MFFFSIDEFLFSFEKIDIGKNGAHRDRMTESFVRIRVTMVIVRGGGTTNMPLTARFGRVSETTSTKVMIRNCLSRGARVLDRRTVVAWEINEESEGNGASRRNNRIWQRRKVYAHRWFD